MLGAAGASVMFAVALMASGQNSTITGTLVGQVVIGGFLNITLPGWLRRLITRLVAVVPAVIVTALYGIQGTAVTPGVHTSAAVAVRLGYIAEAHRLARGTDGQ